MFKHAYVSLSLMAMSIVAIERSIEIKIIESDTSIFLSIHDGTTVRDVKNMLHARGHVEPIHQVIHVLRAGPGYKTVWLSDDQRIEPVIEQHRTTIFRLTDSRNTAIGMRALQENTRGY